jgi:uncharacterized protein (TIGR03000 family)
MYSVVLATMMTVSAGSTGWWGCHGCWGCWGCHGYHSSSGCYGCYGCYGHHYGCYGYGCFGCQGSVVVSYGYPASIYVASGYVTPTYYAPSYVVASSGMSSSSTGSATAMQPQPTADSVGEIARLRAEVEKLRLQLDAQKKKPLEDTTVATSRQPAQVTIHVPADAKLFIDDVVCPLTSDTRSFTTPKLQPGQRYFYDLKAEVVRSGETVSQTQRVVLEAGKDVSVTFPQLPAVALEQR